MPTPSEQTRNAERGVRSKKPRSVFGNFEHGDGRGALASDSGGAGKADVPPQPARAPSGTDGGAPASLQQQIDSAVARAFLYRLAAKLFEYPSLDGWAWLRHGDTAGAIRAAAATIEIGSAAAELVEALERTPFAAFLDAHLTAFGHAARGPLPMNEIEYGDLKADPLFQPHRLADLAAFYRAFGLEIAGDASERQDHVCLQLEFMSVLAAKEAFALEHQLDQDDLAAGRAAQKDFLREHPGRWMPAFARRVERSSDEPALRSVAHLTYALIVSDCARLGVKPGSEDLALRPVDDESDLLCASCGIRNLPPGAQGSA